MATTAQALASIRRRRDPWERLDGAQTLLDTAAAENAEARNTRDLMACTLHRRGHKAVTIYRNVLGGSRNMWYTARAKAARFDYTLTDGMTDDEVRAAGAGAAEVARVTTDDVPLLNEVRAVRDAAITELIQSGAPNHEIAKRTKLTTARIAQMAVPVRAAAGQ